MTPRPPLVLALGLWTAIGTAAIWWPWAGRAWGAVGVLIALVAAIDAWRLRRTPDPSVTRRLGRTLSLGVWSPVRLTLHNHASRPLELLAHDLHPGEMQARGLPRPMRLAAGASVAFSYRLRAPSRGDFALAGCAVALHSPLGLWSSTRILAVAHSLRVIPNLADIRRYTLLAATDQLALIGVRRLQRRGSGAEFHQLRPYQEGDALRQIDWKATARVRSLISREYQDERDQRLLFLLDCGRRMRHREPLTDGQVADGQTAPGHLDQALNALLLLAYVAVRQGDSVGLMTYGGPRRWIAPRKEPATVNRLLRAVYDLQPSLEAADPLAAAGALMQAMPRRALVVVLTNSRDEDQQGLEQAAKLLRRRHLVVIADLREGALDRALEAPIEDLGDALRLHGVHAWLAARQEHHRRLRHLGVHSLDLTPEQLPVALVNRYFAIKRAGGL